MSNVSDCGGEALGVFFGVNLWWQIHNVYHISVAPAGEEDPAHARLGRHSPEMATMDYFSSLMVSGNNEKLLI